MIHQEIYLLFERLKLGKIISIKQSGTYAYGLLYHVKVKKCLMKKVTEYTVCEEKGHIRSVKSLQSNKYYYQGNS